MPTEIARELSALRAEIDDVRADVAAVRAIVAPLTGLLPAIRRAEKEQIRADILAETSGSRQPLWRDPDGRTWVLAIVTRAGLAAVACCLALAGALAP